MEFTDLNGLLVSYTQRNPLLVLLAAVALGACLSLLALQAMRTVRRRRSPFDVPLKAATKPLSHMVENWNLRERLMHARPGDTSTRTDRPVTGSVTTKGESLP